MYYSFIVQWNSNDLSVTRVLEGTPRLFLLLLHLLLVSLMHADFVFITSHLVFTQFDHSITVNQHRVTQHFKKSHYQNLCT
jgi:hypothetical protein